MRRCPIPQCREVLPFASAILCTPHWGMLPEESRVKIQAAALAQALGTRRGIALICAAIATVRRKVEADAASRQLDLFVRGGSDGK